MIVGLGESYSYKPGNIDSTIKEYIGEINYNANILDINPINNKSYGISRFLIMIKKSFLNGINVPSDTRKNILKNLNDKIISSTDIGTFKNQFVNILQTKINNLNTIKIDYENKQKDVNKFEGVSYTKIGNQFGNNAIYILSNNVEGKKGIKIINDSFNEIGNIFEIFYGFINDMYMYVATSEFQNGIYDRVCSNYFDRLQPIEEDAYGVPESATFKNSRRDTHHNPNRHYKPKNKENSYKWFFGVTIPTVDGKANGIRYIFYTFYEHILKNKLNEINNANHTDEIKKFFKGYCDKILSYVNDDKVSEKLYDTIIKDKFITDSEYVFDYNKKDDYTRYYDDIIKDIFPTYDVHKHINKLMNILGNREGYMNNYEIFELFGDPLNLKEYIFTFISQWHNLTINSTEQNQHEIYRKCLDISVIIYAFNLFFEYFHELFVKKVINIVNNLKTLNIKKITTKFLRKFIDYDAKYTQYGNIYTKKYLKRYGNIKFDEQYILPTIHKYISSFTNSDLHKYKYFIVDIPKINDNPDKLVELTHTKQVLDKFQEYNKTLDSKINYELLDLSIKLQKTKNTIRQLSNYKRNELIEILDTSKKNLENISLVMYSSEYSSTDFIKEKKLKKYCDQFVTIENLLYNNLIKEGQILFELLGKDNINNTRENSYLVLKKIILSKLTTPGKVQINQKKIYKFYTLGLLEYYGEIVEKILYKIKNTEMSNLSEQTEQFFYKYHYIILLRLDKFFKWINKYRQRKIMEDEEKIKMKTMGTDKRALEKFIDVQKCKSYVATMLTELNFIKDLLDQYISAFGENVSIHLRINDFTPFDQKKGLTRKVDYMPGIDNEYKLSDQIFYNQTGINDDKNKLIVNFENYINFYYNKQNNPNINVSDTDLANLKVKKLQELLDEYNQVQQYNTKGGIKFNRIYNTIDFPTTDIISNYMSLAANISSKKGITILTYGYSGVGKTDTLFGSAEDMSKGIEQKNGMLQSTFDQFTSGTEIFLRVYEIYGLGTQYNYYWNPEIDPSNQPTNLHDKCGHNIYYMLIHHDLNISGDVMTSNKGYIIDNHHDILAYILNVKNPDGYTKEFNTLQDKDGNDILFNRYYDSLIETDNAKLNFGKMKSYKKIDEKHYRKFSTFIKNLDETREGIINPIKYNRTDPGYDHIIKRIKKTINNPSSSRSILVFDFQIKVDGYFVPFLICDLPGKEDIYKTYIEKNPSEVPTNLADAILEEVDDETMVSVKTVTNLPTKYKKSTYVLNPLSLSFYDQKGVENYTVIINVIKKLTDPINKVISDSLETKIVKEYLNEKTVVVKYNAIDKWHSEENIQLSTFYKNPGTLTTFEQIFNHNELIDEIGRASTGPYVFFSFLQKGRKDTSTENILKETFKFILPFILKIIIKYGMLDVLIKITEEITSWKYWNIYNIYEAFFINENVIGLMQYLISDEDIMKNKKSNFDQQDYTPINESLNEKVYNGYAYDQLKNYTISVPEQVPQSNYPYVQNKNYLNSDNSKRLTDAFPQLLTQKKFMGPQSGLGFNLTEYYNLVKYLIHIENIGMYNDNKVFRSGIDDLKGDCKNIYDPNPRIKASVKQKNDPLLKFILEPYKLKINNYYIFYVVSNNVKILKGEPQMKLLKNSMKMITTISTI
jgi:hypothetical protein